MLLGLAPSLLAALALAAPSLRLAGYAPPRSFVPADTLRPRSSESASSHGAEAVDAAIPGYLSPWGLPPVPGRIVLTDSGLVFHASEGRASTRASSVSLAYVDAEDGRQHYLFRLDAGVFETEAPGPLLEAIAEPGWSSDAGPAVPNRAPVPSDSASWLRAARRIAGSRYADTLYLLLGKPRAAVGLIGARGRAAGRLGEYVSVRDSLALDPARMTGEGQLRHALAHELGHRWQARARPQLATLWTGVRAIPDSKRYGYGSVSEHQAEAIAFAISFLQTTAATAESSAGALALLDHYNLLVPGTRTMVRYFVLQAPYRNHPLRSRLTSGRITYALEK
jgi:hypothetical protein